MFKDFNWVVILLIFGLIFYYSNKTCYEGYRNSRVYIGSCPIKPNNFLFLNDTDFGSHSIYELGKIIKPNMRNKYLGNYSGAYSGAYQNSYPGYYI